MKPNKGSKALLREYLLEHVGEVLESDTLREIAGTSEWGRRIRELRNEEGYLILSHNDRAGLKPGQYILLSSKPGPAFAREISKETRAYVLDRNGFTCQMCGGGAGESHPYNPTQKVRLHIGHIIDKSAGGSDEPENLRAVCSVCNEGAANITLPRPDSSKLIAQIRRSPGKDQIEVLNWLIGKYAVQASELLKAKELGDNIVD